MSMNLKWKKLTSFCPQVLVILKDGKFHVIEEGSWRRNDKWDCLERNPFRGGKYTNREVLWRYYKKWDCLPLNWQEFRLSGEEDNTHFLCRGCYGENHKESSMALVETKHPLHPKHSLQLALMKDDKNRQCYCCDKDLGSLFFYCSACDFGIKFTCAKKPRVLSINHPKWHEHTLALFPSQAPLTCSLCALTHSKCPFYICPPCDFVVHQRCTSLPRVIKISRHHHRISFTYSFDKGDWSCGICRMKIKNDYGGYSCTKNGCPYAAHSICATQSNVWDGIELEGELEEEIEKVEPFTTISSGIIQHFSHEHHLRLDENIGREYDENKLCQACITPIYFGNFYSCLQCDFILHEDCARLSRIIHHPIHPHLLTLVTNKLVRPMNITDTCSTCPSLFIAGFFYECGERDCRFQVHVQCATISEPLVHPSHMYPLFLTSKPDEERICSVCKKAPASYLSKETFNCIEACDFAVCFKCATLPQKVRYKHDKHMFSLSYGKKTSTMTYWCEACEGKINPEKGFYMCDEYCCVNLHIKCMLGTDLYVMPGSSMSYYGGKLHVLPNNMSRRPICSYCKNRCPQKIVFQLHEFTLCSAFCIRMSYRISEMT